MRSGLKGAVLLSLAAMMANSTMGAESYMQYPSRSRGRLPKTSYRGGRTITLEYPDHYTNQQRGFTPSGSAKLHFNGMRDFKKAIHTV